MSPNILFIIADQYRWDALSSFGWVETPALDALAADGVQFDNAFTNAPVCMPARVSLALGQYPHQFGLLRNQPFNLPDDQTTWMSSVREAGYHTSLYGKVHLSGHSADLRQQEDAIRQSGFDVVHEISGPRGCRTALSHMTALWEERGVWQAFRDDYKQRFADKPWVARPSPLPLDLYMDVYIADRAREYLSRQPSNQPWCMSLGFGGPHEPWDAPEPYASLYSPEVMPAPRPRPAFASRLRRGLLKTRFENALPVSLQDVAELRANYAGNIRLIDDKINDVVLTLRRLGEYDNTMIVFTSDHGEMNGDYGLIYKNCFYDAAARIPLIIKPPACWGVETGRRESTLVELRDLGATFIETANAEMPATNHALSLVPLIRGEATVHRSYVISQFREEHMIFDGRWKAIYDENMDCYLLIDCLKNPDESHNALDDLDAKNDAVCIHEYFTQWVERHH